MILCVLVPAFNERDNLYDTLINIYHKLSEERIDHNILVINDHSTDGSERYLEELKLTIPSLRYLNNTYNRGFGNAIRYGLDNWEGDIVAIMMADASDSPVDLVTYYKEISQRDVDCAFGSRFIKGGVVKNYPLFKLTFNRCFNHILSLCVKKDYADYTNAFKAYRRVVIDSCRPFISENFSLTVEIPLKAIKKEFTYSIVPISWTQRKYGYSKLNLLKNANSYFRILSLYLADKL